MKWTDLYNSHPVPVRLVIKHENMEMVFDLKAEKDSTLFNFLKHSIDFDYVEHPIHGVWINSVEGIANSKDRFWIIYINGKLAPNGVSYCRIKEHSSIELRYEKISKEFADLAQPKFRSPIHVSQDPVNKERRGRKTSQTFPFFQPTRTRPSQEYLEEILKYR